MGRLDLENVGKVYRGRKGEAVAAVAGLTLEVAQGELLVLVGPSGCGKTTTLRLVAGLEQPSSGTIRIDGRAVNAVEPQDRGVAMVFQHGALYPHMTVYENLAFGLKLRGGTRAEVDGRVREAAGLLGLAGVLERLPQALSGGQRQRVALGRALVRRPRVFLLDEPLANLDGPLRLQLRVELKRLHARLGATMLHVTHDQVEAMSLGHRLALMRDGVLQQAGPPLELYRRPANLFVATFLGSPPMNLFRGTVASGSTGPVVRVDGFGGRGLSLPGWVAQGDGLGVRPGSVVVLGVRPEEIRPVAVPGAEGIEVAARVLAVEPTGPDSHVHFESGGVGFVARWPVAGCPAPGEAVRVWLDLGGAHWFEASTGRALGAAGIPLHEPAILR
jgi:multiple sugar transport system ATP-binding protein